MKYALIFLLILVSAKALALDESKGMASIAYKGKVTPQLMQSAAVDAKYNALERFVANTNKSKLSIFDAKKSEIMARIDDFVMNPVVISKNDDREMKTFTIVIRAEIHTDRLQNLLNSNTGSRPDSRGVLTRDGKRMVLIIIPRTQSSRKIYDDRVVKRADMSVSGSGKTNEQISVINSESLRSGRESISDSRTDSSNFSKSISVKSETGGSREIKADKVQWSLLSSNEVYAGMSQTFLEAGIRTVKAESLQGINLPSIRNQYASGNDISPESYRSIIASVRAAGHDYVAIGYMDAEIQGVDPQFGLNRVSITVNGNVVEASSGDDLGIFTTTVNGMGKSDGEAQKNGIANASKETAEYIVDQLNTQGF